MNTEQACLAVDLGASSGRLVAGIFDGDQLRLEDVHRFPNGGIHVQQDLHWDVLELWKQIQDGIRAAGSKYGSKIQSIGVDTWGVDFALLGRGDVLLGQPSHYRDRRTNNILDAAFEVMSRDEIFAETGLQFMEFNTLYQMWAMKRKNSVLLENAQTFLMIPDLFHWLLTGVKVNEYTNASTTQFMNPRTGTWADEVLSRFELPREILGELVTPGTNLGEVQKRVCDATGIAPIQVVVPGTHDTASAVMAVPAESNDAESPDWCYISSGTWSLMGAEVQSPVINEKCQRYNFTNEGGVGKSVRLLKNIAGLWLVQECRRSWARRGEDRDWAQLVWEARASQPLQHMIDPDDARFVAPQDMVTTIQDYCRESGQTEPTSSGEVIRCALESLAMRYRVVLEATEQLTGASFSTVHIVGGGAQNELLCQMTADVCGRRVVAGPVEATAIGNVLVQLMATGAVGSVSEARDLVRRSFSVIEYLPQDQAAWGDAFGRFVEMTNAAE